MGINYLTPMDFPHCILAYVFIHVTGTFSVYFLCGEGKCWVGINSGFLVTPNIYQILQFYSVSPWTIYQSTK